jgi:putative transposase
MISRTERSNTRWAIDTTHVWTQNDGWCHLTVVIDCCDREILGWRLSRSGKAKVAMAALEDALLKRKPGNLTLRSDNGLVFGAKAFVRLCCKWRLTQEYITPYTPEQNGLVERLFRSLKDECLWRNNFLSLTEAQDEVQKWVNYYNNDRPHRALNMFSPTVWRSKQAA